MVHQRIKYFLVCLVFSLVGLTSAREVLSSFGYQQKSAKTSTQRKREPTPKPTPTQRPVSQTDALGPAPPIPKLKERPIEDVNPGEVISVNTTEVLLPVTVRDTNGRLVNNLTKSDFRVFEDQREQPLSDISLRQVPVDAVLMVDASSSVAKNLDDFRRELLHEISIVRDENQRAAEVFERLEQDVL